MDDAAPFTDPTLDRSVMLQAVGELTLRMAALANHLDVVTRERDEARAERDMLRSTLTSKGSSG